LTFEKFGINGTLTNCSKWKAIQLIDSNNYPKVKKSPLTIFYDINPIGKLISAYIHFRVMQVLLTAMKAQKVQVLARSIYSYRWAIFKHLNKSDHHT